LATATDAPAEERTVTMPVATGRGRARSRRGRWRRAGWRFAQLGHRWVALASGVFLLMMVLSGVVLLYEPDLQKLLHPSLYAATPAERTISAEQARDAALTAFPAVKAENVIKNRGVWEVHAVLDRGKGAHREIHVDPGTGRVLGVGNAGGGALGVLKNLHMCALTCQDYAGYWGATAYKVKLFGNDELMVGTLLLGLLGLVLLGLAISGIVLWWPGIRRMARGFVFRRSKGAYAVNYDLHKLAGMAAIPFLLMWAVTGAGFEFKQLGDAWYAVLPGDRPAEYKALESKPLEERSVTMAQAERIARNIVPTGRLSSVSVPDPDTKESAYSVWFSEGTDPYTYGAWRGDVEVSVDRYSGRAKVTYGDPSVDRPVSQTLWEGWNFPIHAGTPFNGALRSPWVLFGLVPLLLAVTGVTTWLIRRRRRRARPTLRPAA
jgi:uncharacterized iron-regulated membrane protein